MGEPRMRVYIHQFKGAEPVGYMMMYFTAKTLPTAVETIRKCVTNPVYDTNGWDRTIVVIGAIKEVISR